MAEGLPYFLEERQNSIITLKRGRALSFIKETNVALTKGAMTCICLPVALQQETPHGAWVQNHHTTKFQGCLVV